MWGSLSSAHQIMVLLALKGGPEYSAQMKAAAAETGMLGKAVLTTSEEMQVATKRSWLHNQALFTARRYAFYATLAITGLAYEVFKLGVSYNNTVQQAKVALGTILPKQQLDDVISRLYRISTLSPFLFQDTLQAFRMLYPAFHAAGISVKDALDSIQGSANALAVQGKLSSGQLTRVAVQLQHLANIGKPTGQILTALARDGLPVYTALRKELGLTGTSLASLASTGITAKQVIEAINKYMITAPPYANAAFRISTQTLQGNWQMFKDILAQASGSATGGLFMGLTARLKAINEAFLPMLATNKPIGLMQVVEAIDKGFTPNTHIILNLFIAFNYALKTTIFLLDAVAKTISFAARAFNFMMGIMFPFVNMIRSSHIMTKAFGISLGVLLTIFLLAKAALLPFIIAIDLWKSAVRAAQAVAAVYRVTLFILNGEYAAAWALITGKTVATEANTVANEANSVSEAQKALLTDIMSESIVANTAAVEANTVAMAEADAAMWANPIGLIILAVLALTAGLIILYFKWKAFHDLVNKTFGFLWSHPWAAAMIPIIGQLIVMAKVLTEIYNHAAAIAGFVQHPIRGIQHAIHGSGGWSGTAIHIGEDIAKYLLPGLQTGGFVGGSGLAMVGEHGPELVHLPAASVVQPFSRNMLSSG